MALVAPARSSSRARRRPGVRPRRPGALGAAAALTAVLAAGLTPPSPPASPAGEHRLADAVPVAAPAPVAQCTPDPLLCPAHLRFGAFTDGQPLNLAPLEAFATAVGFNPDIALTFTSFRFRINEAALRDLVATGRTPMVTWEPFDATDPTADTFHLADLAAGAYDEYLAESGRRLAAVGAPVAVRFAHEMNGGWYPWGVAGGTTTAAEYVAAFRHVHDVVRAAGGTNVIWVWSPSVLAASPSQPLEPLYPGDEYVDWVGLSAYYDDPTDTWANTVAASAAAMDVIAPTKPMLLVETGVLDVAERPQMITDLVQGVLRTPRMIGLTWFDAMSRESWRIDDDPAALAALGDGLRSGWFAPAGASGPQLSVAVPPLLQVPPRISGTAKVGSTLTVVPAAWRPAPWVASTPPTGRWWRCKDPVDTTTCQGQPAYGSTYLVTTNDLGQYLRYRETFPTAAGTGTSWSPAAGSAVMLPATPAAPVVESWNGGARIVFPAPPRGTTHWRLTVDGVVYEPVPVARPDYWLTGLVNGRSYAVSLQAVSASEPLTLVSAPTSGTVVPMATPWVPYVAVTGQSATFTFPQAPTGSVAWVLTVDGVPRVVDRAQATATVADLAPGVVHTWSLQAGAGSWPGTGVPGGFSALTPPRTGTFLPLATPPAPQVASGGGTITLTFGPPPAGATAWRVSIGPTSYPNIPLTQTSFTVSGLYPGYPATWTVRATNDLAASLPVTGKAVP